MQKRLLAAAVAGALAVPVAAVAQSTVQIYGQAEWEQGYMDQGGGRPKTDYNESTGSYLGFRGTESLGGGLSAWFQCETTMDIRAIDQVGLCSRNSGLGFRGGFGNVWVGRWHTPMSRSLAMGSVGGEETGILGVSYLAAGGSGSTSIGGTAFSENEGGSPLRRRFRRRETCLTTYETPNMSGFMLGVAVSCGNAASEGTPNNQDNSSNQKPRVWSFAGNYVSGPLSIGISYEKHVDVGVSSITPSTADLDDRGWGISAAYNFGAFRVGGFYLDRKWDQPDGDVKAKSATIGVEWNIAGPHQLHFNYNWLDDAEGSSLLGIEATSQGGIQAPNAIVNGVRQGRSDTGAQSFTIGYQYNFSKRTSAKIGYTLMDNDSNSRSARLGTAPSVINAGDDQSAIALVVKHRF